MNEKFKKKTEAWNLKIRWSRLISTKARPFTELVKSSFDTLDTNLI